MAAKKKRKNKEPKYDNMPPPIPDTPENVARIAMQGPPKKKWRYMEKNGNDGQEGVRGAKGEG